LAIAIEHYDNEQAEISCLRNVSFRRCLPYKENDFKIPYGMGEQTADVLQLTFSVLLFPNCACHQD
jgi:hypothetical protein